MKTYSRWRSRPSSSSEKSDTAIKTFAGRQTSVSVRARRPRSALKISFTSSSSDDEPSTPSTSRSEDALPTTATPTPESDSGDTEGDTATAAVVMAKALARERRRSTLTSVPICSLAKSPFSANAGGVLGEHKVWGDRAEDATCRGPGLVETRRLCSSGGRDASSRKRRRQQDGQGGKSGRRAPASTERSLPSQQGKKEQTFLDFGQRSFGQRALCSSCGMLYVCGSDEDEARHASLCAKTARGVEFAGWKKERVRGRYTDNGGRVVEIREGDPAAHIAKLREVERLMDEDMGFAPGARQEGIASFPVTPGSGTAAEQTPLLSTGKKKISTTAFLYVRDRRVLGCVVAQRIQRARRVAPAEEWGNAGADSEEGRSIDAPEVVPQARRSVTSSETPKIASKARKSPICVTTPLNAEGAVLGDGVNQYAHTRGKSSRGDRGATIVGDASPGRGENCLSQRCFDEMPVTETSTNVKEAGHYHSSTHVATGMPLGPISRGSVNSAESEDYPQRAVAEGRHSDEARAKLWPLFRPLSRRRKDRPPSGDEVAKPANGTTTSSRKAQRHLDQRSVGGHHEMDVAIGIPAPARAAGRAVRQHGWPYEWVPSRGSSQAWSAGGHEQVADDAEACRAEALETPSPGRTAAAHCRGMDQGDDARIAVATGSDGGIKDVAGGPDCGAAACGAAKKTPTAGGSRCTLTSSSTEAASYGHEGNVGGASDGKGKNLPQKSVTLAEDVFAAHSAATPTPSSPPPRASQAKQSSATNSICNSAAKEALSPVDREGRVSLLHPSPSIRPLRGKKQREQSQQRVFIEVSANGDVASWGRADSNVPDKASEGCRDTRADDNTGEGVLDIVHGGAKDTAGHRRNGAISRLGVDSRTTTSGASQAAREPNGNVKSDALANVKHGALQPGATRQGAAAEEDWPRRVGYSSSPEEKVLSLLPRPRRSPLRPVDIAFEGDTDAVIGVLQMWVHKSYRRQGVATRLLDTVREKMVYGLPLRRQEVAFSQPTSEGFAFATRYTGGHLLIY